MSDGMINISWQPAWSAELQPAEDWAGGDVAVDPNKVSQPCERVMGSGFGRMGLSTRPTGRKVRLQGALSRQKLQLTWLPRGSPTVLGEVYSLRMACGDSVGGYGRLLN